jgi:hypothetical protein
MTPKLLRAKWPEIEQQLRVGDILFLHNRRDLISWLIRNRSHSYWSHTAMVFKDHRIITIGGPLIVEASGQGIEIHQLKKYSDFPEHFDIGIKRFPGLNYEQRIEMTKSFILNNIDTPYDYGRLFGFLFGPFIAKFSKPLQHQFQKFMIHSDAFICSSFIHKTFHHFMKHTRLPKNTDLEHLDLEAEEMWTPADIAKEQAFEWIFNKRR